MTDLKLIAGIAKLGEIFGKTETEKNNWKKRFVSKIPGIDFPDDFDGLPENVKTERLNKALSVLTEKK